MVNLLAIIHLSFCGRLQGPIIRNLTTSDDVAEFVSTLSLPFEGGTISGFDFNPVADRLRLVGDNDQDFRINVDTGAVIVDGDLAFAADDINAGVNPNVTTENYRIGGSSPPPVIFPDVFTRLGLPLPGLG
jgi:hypothetical protein